MIIANFIVGFFVLLMAAYVSYFMGIKFGAPDLPWLILVVIVYAPGFIMLGVKYSTEQQEIERRQGEHKIS